MSHGGLGRGADVEPTKSAPIISVDEEADEEYADDDSTSPSMTTPSNPSPPSTGSTLHASMDCTSTYPHCPVFVPSSGRAELERGTLALLVRDLIPFTVVVEKEEAQAYNDLIDRLVRTFYFGVKGPEALAEAAAKTNTNSAASTVGSEKVPVHLQCACCEHPRQHVKVEKNEADDEDDAKAVIKEESVARTLKHSDANSGAAGTTTAHVAQSVMAALSTAYHHGYIYQPEAAAEGASSYPSKSDPCVKKEKNAKDRQEAGTGDSLSSRVVSAPFIITRIEDVRALFTVAELPASRKGVSYVRNYILHVLAPQRMLASGVDDEKANNRMVHETALFAPQETGKLSATMMASALTSEQALHELKSAHAAALVSASPFEAAVAAFHKQEQQREKETEAHGPSVSAGAPPMPFPQYEALRQKRAQIHHQLQQVDSPHALVGFYWVLDDDITALHKTMMPAHKLERISVRAMMSEMEARVCQLRANSQRRGEASPTTAQAAADTSAASAFPFVSGIRPASGFGTAPPVRFASTRPGGAIFTGREDVLANNSSADGNNNSSVNGSALTLQNFDQYPLIACYSLEYSRFAFSYDDDALGINTYNNIACLFNYRLLHDPPCPPYYPRNLLGNVVRSPEEVLVGYAGRDMMWYRFAVREDYDFTLQLIARGMCTVRLRNLSFAAPQMAKSRGGMTDYYKHCLDDIERQNGRFVQQWPAVAQHWVKGKGDTARKDIRVRWDLLHPARARYPGAYLYLAEPLPQLQPQVIAPAPPPPPTAATVEAQHVPTLQQQEDPPVAVNAVGAPSLVVTGPPNQLRAHHSPPAHAGVPVVAAAPAKPQKMPVNVAALLGQLPTLPPGRVPMKSAMAPLPAPAPQPRSSPTSPAPALSTPSAAPPVSAPDVKRAKIESPQPPPPPQEQQPMAVSTKPADPAHSAKWKGYTVLPYRDLDPDDASRFGLRPIPDALLRVGASVSVVPPLFTQRPSVVQGTVIEKSHDEQSGRPLWSVVSSIRGMPILCVADCYEPLKTKSEEAAAIAAVDAFFQVEQR